MGLFPLIDKHVIQKQRYVLSFLNQSLNEKDLRYIVHFYAPICCIPE